MKKLLVIFFLFSSSCSSANGDRKPDAAPESTESRISDSKDSNFHYDGEEEKRFGNFLMSVKHEYGIEIEESRKSVISGYEAMSIMIEYPGLESMGDEFVDQIRTSLSKENSVAYMYTFDKSPLSQGLPDSLIYIPIPIELRKSKSKRDTGVVILNRDKKFTSSPKAGSKEKSILYLNLDEMNAELNNEKLLLVVAGRCSSYDHFVIDNPLRKREDIVKYTTFYVAKSYMSNRIHVNRSYIPLVLFIKDGKIEDIHYGYESGKDSINSFLSRNRLIESHNKYYATVDQDYVASRNFKSIKKWLTANKLNLSGLVLENLDMSHTVLYRCSLNGSSLKNSNLSGADLRLCDFTGTNLSGANLDGARIKDAMWKDTTCPDGTNSDDMPSKSCL